MTHPVTMPLHGRTDTPTRDTGGWYEYSLTRTLQYTYPRPCYLPFREGLALPFGLAPPLPSGGGLVSDLPRVVRFLADFCAAPSGSSSGRKTSSRFNPANIESSLIASSSTLSVVSDVSKIWACVSHRSASEYA